MSANGSPHPDGDRWSKVLTDQELERMYRKASSPVSGSGAGGGINQQGCLILLAWVAFVAAAIGWWFT